MCRYWPSDVLSQIAIFDKSGGPFRVPGRAIKGRIVRQCLLFPIAIFWLGGCAASKPAVQQAAAAPTSTSGTSLVSPDRLASLPAGRYCQVTGSDPRDRYEGTIVRASAKELVLTDVVTRSVESIPILGQLPFRWSR